jgi:mannose-6-phosphate isomerase-like protein (cupin superfamily)
MPENNFYQLAETARAGHFSHVIGQVKQHQVCIRVMEEHAVDFHTHPDSDELFIVLKGQLFVDLEDASITLKQGQVYTVPAGQKHRARADARVEFLAIIA